MKRKYKPQSELQQLSQRVNFAIMRLKCAESAIMDAWRLVKQLNKSKVPNQKNLTTGIGLMIILLKSAYKHRKQELQHGQK